VGGADSDGGARASAGADAVAERAVLEGAGVLEGGGMFAGPGVLGEAGGLESAKTGTLSAAPRLARGADRDGVVARIGRKRRVPAVGRNGGSVDGDLEARMLLDVGHGDRQTIDLGFQGLGARLRRVHTLVVAVAGQLLRLSKLGPGLRRVSCVLVAVGQVEHHTDAGRELLGLGEFGARVFIETRVSKLFGRREEGVGPCGFGCRICICDRREGERKERRPPPKDGPLRHWRPPKSSELALAAVLLGLASEEDDVADVAGVAAAAVSLCVVDVPSVLTTVLGAGVCVLVMRWAGTTMGGRVGAGAGVTTETAGGAATALSTSAGLGRAMAGTGLSASPGRRVRKLKATTTTARAVTAAARMSSGLVLARAAGWAAATEGATDPLVCAKGGAEVAAGTAKGDGPKDAWGGATNGDGAGEGAGGMKDAGACEPAGGAKLACVPAKADAASRVGAKEAVCKKGETADVPWRVEVDTRNVEAPKGS
jgi:hypothetical protein